MTTFLVKLVKNVFRDLASQLQQAQTLKFFIKKSNVIQKTMCLDLYKICIQMDLKNLTKIFFVPFSPTGATYVGNQATTEPETVKKVVRMAYK